MRLRVSGELVRFVLNNLVVSEPCKDHAWLLFNERGEGDNFAARC